MFSLNVKRLDDIPLILGTIGQSKKRQNHTIYVNS